MVKLFTNDSLSYLCLKVSSKRNNDYEHDGNSNSKCALLPVHDDDVRTFLTAILISNQLIIK